MWHNYSVEPLSPGTLARSHQNNISTISGHTQLQPWAHEEQVTPPPPPLSFYSDQYPVPPQPSLPSLPPPTARATSAHPGHQSYSNAFQNASQLAQKPRTQSPGADNQAGQLWGRGTHYPDHCYSTPHPQPMVGLQIPPVDSCSPAPFPPVTGNHYPITQTHAPNRRAPSAVNVSYPADSAQSIAGSQPRPTFQPPQPVDPLYQGELQTQNIPTANTGAPNPALLSPEFASYEAPNHVGPDQASVPQHMQSHTLGFNTDDGSGAAAYIPRPSPAVMASYAHHPHPQLHDSGRTTVGSRFPQAIYGGFLQTHQVKNVQVFTGNADSKMLVEDWIRDMQYLLDAIDLPVHLRFSTVVRHLNGEARKLVLNLPPSDQTPEKAFNELRAEYSDTQGWLDPLADFYERSQRSCESACSYAIALEATLRAVEENQRGGRPFPDRDSKLTRQFLRGLIDEQVYARIAPMKPMFLSFRELQTELRNMARETNKFQPHNKIKKTFTQVQMASEISAVRVEGKQYTSELSELTEIVRKLALNQEEQMAKLSKLESSIKSSKLPPNTSFSSAHPSSHSSGVTCHRCGNRGHIARFCRAVLPDSTSTGTQVTQRSTSSEEISMPPAESLNA